MMTYVKNVEQLGDSRTRRFEELRTSYRALVRSIESEDLRAAQHLFYGIEGLQALCGCLSDKSQVVFDELGISITTDDASEARRLLRSFRLALRDPLGTDDDIALEQAVGDGLDEEEPEPSINRQSGIVPRPSVEQYAIEAIGAELPPTAAYDSHG